MDTIPPKLTVAATCPSCFKVRNPGGPRCPTCEAPLTRYITTREAADQPRDLARGGRGDRAASSSGTWKGGKGFDLAWSNYQAPTHRAGPPAYRDHCYYPSSRRDDRYHDS